MRKNLFLALGASAIVTWAGSRASAQTTQTWNTATAGSDWSGNGNWSPAGAVSGNDLIFGDAFGKTASTTVGNIVDADVTINSLTYNNTGSSGSVWQVTNINSGATLTLDAATAPATIFTVGGVSAASTRAAIQGSGTFTINESTSSIYVGGPNAGQSALLDMQALATFNATVSSVNFGGSSSRANGDVNLALANTITAGSINIGTSSSSTTSATKSDLQLGGTNALNANSITIGSGMASGTITFRSGQSSPTAVIRGQSGGSSRADFTVANATGTIGNGQSSSVDFSGSGGSVDAMINNLLVGRRSDAGATTSYTGSFTMAAGTVNATAVVLGQSAGTGSASNSVTGTLAISGGSFTAGSLSMADNSAGATSAFANLNISGTAAVTVEGNLTAGSKSGSAGTVTANINLSGGTLLVLGDLTEGTGPSGVTSSVTVTGGTLDLDHGTLSVDNYSQTAGTLKDVASFAAGTTGGLNLQNSSKLAFDVDSGFTTLTLTGSLALGTSSDLVLSLANGYTPGSSFTLVDNDLSDAISGSFATINGSAFGAGDSFSLTNNLGTFDFQLLYTGGTGNDLVVQAVPEPSTYALVGLGLAGLWLLHRRSRTAIS